MAELEEDTKLGGLKVYRPDDPFFEEGDLCCALNVKVADISIPNFEKTQSLIQETQELSCNEHICNSCSRLFPNERLLELHILESHDVLFKLMAERQCMYECPVVGCHERFATASVRKDHLVNSHHYPSDFRFLSMPKSASQSSSSEGSSFPISPKAESEMEEEDTQSRELLDDAAQRTQKPKVPINLSFGRGRSLFVPQEGKTPKSKKDKKKGKSHGKFNKDDSKSPSKQPTQFDQMEI